MNADPSPSLSFRPETSISTVRLTSFSSDLPFRDSSAASLQSLTSPQKRTKEVRRLSEGSAVDTEQLRAVTRSPRRLKTMPLPEESRHDDVQIPPEAQAMLHKLHEAHKKKHQGLGVASACEDLSATALNSWAGESWHVHTQLPPGNQETEFNVRACKVLPNRDFKANPFLAEQGVAAINTKGCKGTWDKSLGQDACSVSHLSQGWEVLCLMDGHGSGGHWPAMQAVRTLPYILQNSASCITMLRHGKVDAALHHAFDKVQQNLVYESIAKDMDLQVCGCTALCVLQHAGRDSLWVATAGDSRAVLLVPGRGAVAQTVDHKPSLESERLRLEKMGCEVVRTVHEDGFVEERVNIAGEDFPGLCMSRSLGDLALKEHGVTYEPEVVEWSIGGLWKDQSYVLAASDGVWEFLSAESVADLVLAALGRGDSLLAACQELVKRARETWAVKEEGYCDDITVILAPVARWPRSTSRTSFCGDCCCSKGPGKLAAQTACVTM